MPFTILPITTNVIQHAMTSHCLLGPVTADNTGFSASEDIQCFYNNNSKSPVPLKLLTAHRSISLTCAITSRHLRAGAQYGLKHNKRLAPGGLRHRVQGALKRWTEVMQRTKKLSFLFRREVVSNRRTEGFLRGWKAWWKYWRAVERGHLSKQ